MAQTILTLVITMDDYLGILHYSIMNNTEITVWNHYWVDGNVSLAEPVVKPIILDGETARQFAERKWLDQADNMIEIPENEISNFVDKFFEDHFLN